MPIYNAYEFLRLAIESVVSQTLRELEIICIDDGSTDHSVEIVKEYQKTDDRIRIIAENNAGPALARNNGIKRARGEYLAFFDADDFYEPTFLEALYTIAKRDDLDIAISRYDIYNNRRQRFEEVIEDDYRKIYAGSSYAKNPKSQKLLPPRSTASKIPGVVPVFRGFEDDRYQAHDALILKLTADFNAHKANWIGGTAVQAAKTAALTPAMVKAHMIEESGGNGPASLAAWRVDPLQVTVPGDWDDAKIDLGLRKPAKRNEGKIDANVRAAIMFLARTGFGKSGKAARLRPTGFFDGWRDALRRYNARRDRTADGRSYSDAYATKILSRAKDPDAFVPIEIKLAK